MNNEETKILNISESNPDKDSKSSKTGTNEKVAFASGGFVAGVAAGAGTTAYANKPKEEPISTEEVPIENKDEIKDTESTEVEAKIEEKPTESAVSEIVSNEENQQEAPAPEDILLATDEGIKVGQVNDSASFSEAFADARAQVGPGGVFEWRGQVYGTYYENEWNDMSSAERAEFQSKVDYSTITGSEPSSTNVSDLAGSNVVEENSNNVIASDAEMVDQDHSSDEIKVLGVEAVTDPNGNPVTVAGIEVDGRQALLIDVDNNGTMDVIAADLNQDGQLSENEFQDVSEANIETNDLQQMMEQQHRNDVYYASNDDMPDYVNDADVNSMA